MRFRVHPYLLTAVLLAACGTQKSTLPPVTPVPLRMGAIGDSITRAADAVQFAYSRADYISYLNVFDIDRLILNIADHATTLSWSAGDAYVMRASSHYGQLTALGATVTMDNQAVNGAMASGLAAQVTTLLSRGTPDYVTILIGGNDLCRNATPGTPVNAVTFVGLVRSAIQQLRAANSQIKILVGAVPPVADLWSHRNTLVEGSTKTCGQVWTTLRTNVVQPVEFCDPVFFGDGGSTDPANGGPGDPHYDNVVTARAAMNVQLSGLPAEFPSNVKFASSQASETTIPFANVSDVDCFHPSIAGQKYLGTSSWAAGWYTGGL